MGLFKRHKQESISNTHETFPTDESMLASENSDVRFILRGLSSEEISGIASYSKALESQTFTENPDLSRYNNELQTSLSSSEASELKNYTGYNYKGINSVSRGIWNYDELGQKTKEKEDDFRKSAEMISEAIRKSPKLPENTMVFRGTNIDSFRGYGVSSIDDLKRLEGQLFYERGFSSASLSRETSFKDKEFDDTYRKPCNIEIEYHLASGTRDGIALTDDSLTYSKSQNEFLLDKNCLTRILGVETQGDGAKIVMAVIPKEIWAQ